MKIKIPNDEFYMQQAIAQAEKAFAADEVPIGAVIVNNAGEIIGRGYNQVEKQQCQTAHAEATAIKKACKKIDDWRLDECTMYVTLEPCIMCIGLIQLSRIFTLVFAARSPLFGYHLDNYMESQLYKKGIITVREGVLEDQAAELLKRFFKQKRK
ncbi:MAG TPA: nucleoside deaminase [Candidatus Babeliales bacterium]|nr:nucleoside deaminase [Candidatus Babeliales bacterium]